MAGSHKLWGLFIVIVLIAVIWYLNKNDNPIENDGIVMDTDSTKSSRRLITGNYNHNHEMSDNIVDELVSQCNSYSPSDATTRNDFGPFQSYDKKRQLNSKHKKYSYIDYNDNNDNNDNNDDNDDNDDDDNDEKVFTYKKKTFVKRTPHDIKDLFDRTKMMPQEKEDWFDTPHVQDHTKQIHGTQLIDPKMLMGVNSVGSSLRYPSHDIRGDIPNPKIRDFIWGNSTIEPDTNIKGLC